MLDLQNQWRLVMNEFQLLDDKSKRELQNALKGEEGEDIFYNKWIKAYLNPNIIIWRDVRLEANGMHRQIDLIAYDNKTMYLFDVKNYEGMVTIKDNLFMINEREVVTNIFQKSFEHVRFVSSWLELYGFSKINISAYLIFINEHMTFAPDSELNEIVIQRNNIRRLLQGIRYHPANYKSDKLISTIDKHQIKNPFVPPVVERSLVISSPKCPICRIEYSIINSRHFICKCGCKKSREAFAFENICKYGVIYHHKPLIVRDLYKFFGGMYSRSYLNQLLQRNFVKIKGGYLNPQLLSNYYSKNKEFRYKDSKKTT